MKVLITGANGFVGSYLSALLTRSHQVIATGKGDSRLFFAHPNLEYHHMDFTSEDEVKNVIGVTKPDVIVHSGAMSKPDECQQNKEEAWRANVTSTKYLLEEAGALGAYFCFLSTDFIFDGKTGFYKEDDEPGPVNYYGETKLSAEQLVKNYPGDFSIIRTVLVYGHPRSGRQNLLTTVAAALEKKQEVKIFNDQVRTPTYVEDLAWAISRMIELRKTGVFHISGKDVLTPYQMAVAVAEYLRLDGTLIKKLTEPDLEQPAKRPLKTGFDISKARQELGYAPTSFSEGLMKTFQNNILPLRREDAMER